jgi:hypothetical protein
MNLYFKQSQTSKFKTILRKRISPPTVITTKIKIRTLVIMADNQIESSGRKVNGMLIKKRSMGIRKTQNLIKKAR